MNSLEKLDHIGIAVKDLQVSIPVFEKLLGIPCYKIEEVPGQGVITAFFKVGEIKIELVSSLNQENSLSKFLEKKGEGLHHLAFQVDNLEGNLDRLEKVGFSKIGLEPSRGAEGKWIQFLHPEKTSWVLIELCQDSK